MPIQHQDSMPVILEQISILTGKPVDEITFNGRFKEDLSIDSLEFVELISMIEVKLNIRLPDEQIAKCQTPDDLMAVVSQMGLDNGG